MNTSPAITLHNLCVQVGSKVLLDIASLRIDAGERIAVVGHNGAGKTTLLCCLNGFVQPTHGTVTVMGRTVGAGMGGKGLRELRAEVGQLMQGLHLVHRVSALDNVLMGLLGQRSGWRTWARVYSAQDRAAAHAALADVGMLNKADVRCDRLSGGERQKVAIARMLMQRPRLILADEPTASLDPLAASEICSLLARAATGATLMTVVHNPSLLPLLAERVLGLKEGRIVFDLPVQDVDDLTLSRLYQMSAPTTPDPWGPVPPPQPQKVDASNKRPAVNSAAPPIQAGRSCPLHYRYAPAVFHASAAHRCEVLYVVGGLYGNEQALHRVLELFAAERGPKKLVFNGDFNWFNIAPAAFERVNTAVLGHLATRGNVETELEPQGSDQEDDDTGAGCGCAYPDWVGDDVVRHSNTIMRRLRATAGQFPHLVARLAQLPMHLRVDVGPHRVGIVHGDAESLAGWGFAQESLRNPAHQARLQQWFAQAQVDVFASSHTCLPMFYTGPASAHTTAPIVLNNGAAGMPNFAGMPYGLLTRIATHAYRGPERALGLPESTLAGLHMDAIALQFDISRWQQEFLAQWPAGSAAHDSYWSRITAGPNYHPEQAMMTFQGHKAIHPTQPPTLEKPAC